jgi:hypothetical protein
MSRPSATIGDVKRGTSSGQALRHGGVRHARPGLDLPVYGHLAAKGRVGAIVMVFDAVFGGNWRLNGARKMNVMVLIGAIIGSGLFIALGRAPAEKLIAVVQRGAKGRR